MSFAKNRGKNVSSKYDQKVLDSAKKSTADAIKIVSKKAIQKTAEATGDLIGNEIADKITDISKNFLMELHSKKLQNNEVNDEIEIPKERYLSQKKYSKLLMN